MTRLEVYLAAVELQIARIHARIERKRVRVRELEEQKRTMWSRALQALRPTQKDIRAAHALAAPGAVSASDLGRELGINVRTLQEWAQKGLIPSVPFGKQRRFLVDAVKDRLAVVVVDGRVYNTKGSERSQQRAIRAEERASDATHRVCCTCRQPYPLSSYPPSARKRGSYMCGDCKSPYTRASDARRRSSIELTQVEHVSTLKVAKRDNWTCWLCSGAVTRATWSIDHVIPLSKGGAHTYENIKLAHRVCNSIKNAKLPSELADR